MKTDWTYRIMVSIWMLICLSCFVFGIYIAIEWLTTKPPKTITKCDTEKQVEFVLKCIAINPNNKEQEKLVKQCNWTAESIFCTETTIK